MVSLNAIHLTMGIECMILDTPSVRHIGWIFTVKAVAAMSF